jgi:hypothetical protein
MRQIVILSTVDFRNRSCNMSVQVFRNRHLVLAPLGHMKVDLCKIGSYIGFLLGPTETMFRGVNVGSL